MATGCLLREKHFCKPALKHRTSRTPGIPSRERVSGLCVGPCCLLPALNRRHRPTLQQRCQGRGLSGGACGLLSASPLRVNETCSRALRVWPPAIHLRCPSSGRWLGFKYFSIMENLRRTKVFSDPLVLFLCEDVWPFCSEENFRI